MKEAHLKTTFFRYVSLNVIGMIGLSCYILADTFFVAQGLGAAGLAALNLAIPVYSFIHGTGLMLGMGGATRFAISKSEQSFSEAVCYALLASFLFVMAGVLFADQMALSLGANGETLQNAAIYLKTILCFSPMFLLNNVVICFVRNDNAPSLAMLAMLVGSFSNIVLDYVFIFPCGMGMFGAAFATGIAPVISLLLLSTHFLKKNNTFHFSRQRLQLRGGFDLARLGSSALITEFSSGIVIIVFNTIILKLEGNTGVAAYGIIANIALVVTAVFTGIAQGMQPILSRCYSEGQEQNTKQTLKYGLTTAVFVAVLVYAVSFIFAKPIVAAFNEDANLQLTQLAVHGLRIYFTAFGFVGINILSAAYFSAVDQPSNAFLVSLLRGFLIIVPAAFILSAFFGMNGVWLAMAVTEFLVLLVAAHRMRHTVGAVPCVSRLRVVSRQAE